MHIFLKTLVRIALEKLAQINEVARSLQILIELLYLINHYCMQVRALPHHRARDMARCPPACSRGRWRRMRKGTVGRENTILFDRINSTLEIQTIDML